MGQLQDAGKAVTLAHCNAGLVLGLQKYAGQHDRRRSSSPKLNVLNMALMSVGSGYTKAEAQADRNYRSRVVESVVGAHLHNTAAPDCRLWRDGTDEANFVLQGRQRLVAIEREFGTCRHLLIGDGGIRLAEFLSYPAEH